MFGNRIKLFNGIFIIVDILLILSSSFLCKIVLSSYSIVNVTIINCCFLIPIFYIAGHYKKLLAGKLRLSLQYYLLLVVPSLGIVIISPMTIYDKIVLGCSNYLLLTVFFFVFSAMFYRLSIKLLHRYNLGCRTIFLYLKSENKHESFFAKNREIFLFLKQKKIDKVNFNSLVSKYHCDYIFLSDEINLQQYSEIIDASKQLGISCYQFTSSDVTEILPVYDMEHKFWQIVAKQLFDIAISSFILIVLAPLILLIGIIVRFTSHGSSIFKQDREGYFGQHFTIYKFRTMHPNDSHLPVNNNRDLIHKQHNHRHLTLFGKLLRKLSLDELPQFVNILKGDMSFVGPRPLLLHESEHLTNLTDRRRYSMKPGLTGLWQVSGRSNIRSLKKRIELDLKYINNWSLLTDLIISLRTIIVIISTKGAH